MKARWSTTALLGATVWATASLVGGVFGAGPAGADTAPVVHVSSTSVAMGQLLPVTGAGWSPIGQTVQIEICGQNARDLSNDCDQANQYTAAIRAGGIFYGALTVHIPPAPCPCVVVVSDQSGLSAANVPITILGAPIVAVPPPVTPAAPVALSAKVQTPVSVSGWFGGPKSVTLVLRVTNLSHIMYESPALTVNVGKGRNPTGFVEGITMAPLAAGATQVLRIPVTLPPFTAGHYTVRAQVITGQGQVSTVVGTTTYPWGLLAVAVVLLVVFLIWWTRRHRRGRRQPTDGQDVATEETAIDLTQPLVEPSAADTAPDVEEPAPAPAGSEHLDLTEVQALPDSEVERLSREAAENVLRTISEQSY
jgi:hypothetical protein